MKAFHTLKESSGKESTSRNNAGLDSNWKDRYIGTIDLRSIVIKFDSGASSKGSQSEQLSILC